MALELCVVVPTFNERENVPLLIEKLRSVLHGVTWEVIFVDDDSSDGTPDVIAAYARADTGIRMLQRVGRRGLASACIEGMLATQAPVLAVMDADLQHDASILPEMLRRLRHGSLDVVIGTRNADGGSMGDFSRGRVLLSRAGQKISHCVCRCELSDPMSGYFLLRRGFLTEVVHDLSGEGFKILVDLLASARRPVRVAEVGYTFRARSYGESKLDATVGIEYLFMVLNKLVGDVLPVHLMLYMLVGCLGVATHLLTLFFLVDVRHEHFITAQIIATAIAMCENFSLNNRFTFRDRRLSGRHLLPGVLRFLAACSFGAWANVIFARALLQSGVGWLLAGFAGILIASVWNLSVSSFVTWPAKGRPHRLDDVYENTLVDAGEVIH